MTSVNQPPKILTEQEFNKSPYKTIMSYSDYCTKALKYGSAFTVARAMTMVKAEKTTQDINESVEGWYVEKEKDKAKSKDEYEEALALYNATKSGNESAIRDLKYATSMYGEDSTQYSDALKKYKLSNTSLFNSDVNLSIARDHFNSANTSAFKAYLTSRLNS